MKIIKPDERLSDKDLETLIAETKLEYNDCKNKEFVEERLLGIADEKYFADLLNGLKELQSFHKKDQILKHKIEQVRSKLSAILGWKTVAIITEALSEYIDLEE